MNYLEKLVQGFDKADRRYRETGDPKYKEDAQMFAAAIREEQQKAMSEEAEPLSREEELAARREQVGEGQNLRIGPFDTGIEMPQEVTELLAGAGRRLTDIGTLGNREKQPEADELLDDSGYATAGGILADTAVLSALGLAATPYRAAGGAARGGQAAARGGQSAGQIGVGPLQGSARAATDAGRIAGSSVPRIGAGQARLAAPGGQVAVSGGVRGGAATGTASASGAIPGVYTSSVSTAPIATGAKVADKARSAVRAVTNPNSLKGAVGGGAAYGAATSEDRAQGALFGGVGGGLGYGITAGLGAAAKPRLAPGAKELLDEGVPLTPGKMLGGGLQTAEDAARSVPFAGAPAAARGREALEGWNKKIINDALDVVDDRLSGHIKAGREAIEIANDKISKKYDELFESAGEFDVDGLFESRVQSLARKADRLGKNERRTFKRILEDAMNDLGSGKVSGRNFKKADSRVRNYYRKMTRTDTPDSGDLRNYLRELHLELKGLFRRQNDEQAASLLDNLDVAYAKMARVNEAANYDGAMEGVFTPAMLNKIVKANTTKKDYAAGKGFDQLEIDQAREMFTPKVGDSGTATRMLTGAGLLGAGYIEPSTIIGAGALAGSYTTPAQRVIRAALANRPRGAEQTRALLDWASQYTGRAGTAYGVNQ